MPRGRPGARSTRRDFLALTAACGTSAVAGCTGDTNDTSNTTDRNSEKSATQRPSAGVTVFTEEVSINDGILIVPLRSGASVTEVRLIGPDGQLFATDSPRRGETSVQFTLLSRMHLGSRKTVYTPGQHVLRAYRRADDGSFTEIDTATIDLVPSFKLLSVSAVKDPGDLRLTFQNIGTGPGPLTAARMFDASLRPGGDIWGGGYVTGPTIFDPGEEVSVQTVLMGFNEEYHLRDGVSPQSMTDTYCIGETYDVTVEYRTFEGQVEAVSATLRFAGTPREFISNQIACSDVELVTTSTDVTTSS